MARRPFFAANWKMFKTIGEAVAWGRTFRELTRDLGDRDLVAAPPFTALAALAAEVKGSNVAVASQDVLLREGRRVHRRRQRGDDRRHRRHLRDRRALGAAPLLWRHRRDGEPQGANRDRRWPHPDRVHRRDPRRARGEPDARRPRSPDQGRPRRHHRRPGCGAGAGLRARVGHRHGPQCHAPAGRRGARAHPVAHPPVVRRRRGRQGAHPLRRDR